MSDKPSLSSLSQEMKNSEYFNFLSLSPPDDNHPMRARLSSPISRPQNMQTQLSFINPLLEPYPPSNQNTDNVGVGSEVPLNEPLTVLSLNTSPILSPYTASCSHSKDNVGDDLHLNSPPPPPPPPPHVPAFSASHSPPAKSGTVSPPYPWATNRRATVHSRKYLLQNNIVIITGKVKCKRCDERFEMKLDLENKLAELWSFIEKKKGTMHDRAPKAWVMPVLPKCEHCGRENSVEPVIGDTKKKAINWLFLFLAQMLGCCTIKQLKYFCKHTNSHRTGAKDRLVYSAYMGLFKQVLPELSNL